MPSGRPPHYHLALPYASAAARTPVPPLQHIKLGSGKGGIIANPNCSTIIALMAVTPLDRVAGVKRMVVSTYQAASGAGRGGGGGGGGGVPATGYWH